MYFVYRHIRLDKNVPFYIGLGTKRAKAICHTHLYERAFAKYNRNKYWNNVVSKTEYDVDIIFESNYYEEVKNKEIEFIALYKTVREGGSLTNLTIGGDGTNGYKMDDDQKKILSDKKKGDLNPNRIHPYTKERREKLSKALKGKKRSFQAKLNYRKANWMNRPIVCKNNNQKFQSASEAARVLFPNGKSKTERTHIARSATHKIQHKGFWFEWNEGTLYEAAPRKYYPSKIPKTEKRWNEKKIYCITNNTEYKCSALAAKALFSNLNHKVARCSIPKSIRENRPYKGFLFRYMENPSLSKLSNKPDGK